MMVAGILAIPAYADSADDARNKLQEIRQQSQNIRDMLNTNKSEQASIQAEIQEIDNNINSTQKEVDALNDNIDVLEDSIDVLQGEIDQLEDKLVKQQSLLGDRLVCMYEGGDVTYLEVLLGARDFQDFLTRMDMVNSIITQDKTLIQGVQDDKKTLDIKAADLDNQRKELEESRRSQKEKAAVLKTSKAEKDDYMKELEDDAAAYEQQLNDLEATSRDLAAQIAATQASTNYSAPQADGTPYAVGTGIYGWPCPGYTEITSEYGMRLHPILGYYKLHTGIDIGAPEGASIVAADSGTVISAGWQGGYGNCVIVDHGSGMSTLYAHMSEILCSEGQSVSSGQSIGLVGSTGYSTGAHLHFEVRVNGDPVDPTGYL